MQLGELPGRLADTGSQLRRAQYLDLGPEREYVEHRRADRVDPYRSLGPVLASRDGRGVPADPEAGGPAGERREPAAAR
jgi:hypothetical protein